MEKALALVFVVRLFVINLKFLTVVCATNLLKTTQKYKLLISLYLLIFSQVILLIFLPILKPQQQNSAHLLSSESFQREAGGVLNQNKVRLTKILLNEAAISAELNKYEQSTKTILSTRDSLINEALLNLALNRYEKYQEKITVARSLDPNWEGWNKPSASIEQSDQEI